MPGRLLYHEQNKRVLHELIDRLTPSDLTSFAEFVEKWATEDHTDTTLLCESCGADYDPDEIAQRNVERYARAFDEGMKFAIAHRGHPAETEWRKARRESADRLLNLEENDFADADPSFPLSDPSDSSAGTSY